MTNKTSPISLLMGALVLTVLCVGCGNSASDEAEISKLPKNPAATPNTPTGGGSVGASPAETVPQQTRPPGT